MSEPLPEAVRVRPIAREDLEIVLAWRNHPDVRRFMYSQREIAFADHEKWFRSLETDPRRHACIVETADRPLGVVNYSEISTGVAEWGFYVVPASRRGTGALLGRAALDHGFESLGFSKICGEALAYNEASMRFHERLGFRREGVLRDHREIEGAFHDVIRFGLLAEEWASIRRSNSPSGD